MMHSLTRGQTLELAPDDGSILSEVRMGLSWDSIKTAGPLGRIEELGVDLDASALLVTADKEVLEIVYYGHLSTSDGSLRHAGDNVTGESKGDDECIDVDLRQLSREVEHIVFVVTSYSGQSFAEIENATARILDLTNVDRELVRFPLTGAGAHTAMVMARISRTDAGWAFTAMGAPGDARIPRELVPLVLGSL